MINHRELYDNPVSLYAWAYLTYIESRVREGNLSNAMVRGILAEKANLFALSVVDGAAERREILERPESGLDEDDDGDFKALRSDRDEPIIEHPAEIRSSRPDFFSKTTIHAYLEEDAE